MARYYFSCPKIYFGEEAITSLCQFNNKRVGIVTDDFMMSSGKTRYLISHMPEASVCIFGEVTPDPDIDILTSGAARFKAFKPDVIIALGGGSSLDAAKGIKVTLEEYFGDHQIDLIAIPTTSGSGSEVTSYAIISDPQNGRKYPLISEQLVPEIAILDPNLVLTAPRHVAVDTGMDVLTHAIEAYVSTKHNEFSSALAEKAIEITGQFLFRSYSNAQDTHARNKMHVAACIAGLAFNSASLGLNHGMAHQLGAHFHVPHGRANAILLPIVIEYNTGITGVTRQSEVALPCVERYCNIARLLGLHGSNEVMTIHSLCNYLRFCANEMKIPSHLHEILPKVTLAEYEAAIPEMADHALEDSCTATNPRTPSKAEVEELFRKLW